MRDPSIKQRQIYDFIVDFTTKNSYPPSIREICRAVGLRSPSSVHSHLAALQEMGYIKKEDRKTRALTTAVGSAMYEKIPVLGKVQAGQPTLAIEEIEEYVPFDNHGRSGEFFALRVQGDSMINAGILDGDIVVVRRQPSAMPDDIVVALIEDGATVKRLAYEKKHIWLVPENPDYDPIDGDECTIIGIVTTLIRRF